MTSLKIKTCPTCGSNRIREVTRDIESTRGGTPYVARGITVEQCPVCGERLFIPAALDQISSQRPRGTKRARRKASS